MHNRDKIIFIKTSVNQNTQYGSISDLVIDKIAENLNSKKYTIKNLNNDINLNNNFLSSKSMSKYYKDSYLYINQIQKAKIIIIGASMINFSYPALLKNFIDKIIVAKKTFSYNKRGKDIGLIKNTKLIIINSMGAKKYKYKFGHPIRLLKGTFKFIGIKTIFSLNIHSVKTQKNINKTKEQIIEKYEFKINKIIKIINKM